MADSVENKEAGFTLIEVLIAMTIFAVGLLATAGMQITALQSNSRAHSVTTINAVAAGIMEEIMTWQPDDPRLIDENGGNARSWDFDPSANINNTLEIAGGGSYVAKYFVSRLVPVDTARLSRITIEVDLTGGFVSQGARKKTLVCLKKIQ